MQYGFEIVLETGCAGYECVRLRSVGLGVRDGDQPTMRVPVEHHRNAARPGLQQHVFYIVQVVAPVSHVSPSSTGQAVSAEVESGDVELPVVEETGNVFVAPTVLAKAVNEQHRCLRPLYRPPSDGPVSYTHLRAHETVLDLVCRLL